jgi:NAD+ synthase (glutamine-hydrolysing)
VVISDLPKTWVYRLCQWLNQDEEKVPWNILEKPPSAELRPDQKDQDSLRVWHAKPRLIIYSKEKRSGIKT